MAKIWNTRNSTWWIYDNGISIANIMEIPHFCTKASISWLLMTLQLMETRHWQRSYDLECSTPHARMVKTKYNKDKLSKQFLICDPCNDWFISSLATLVSVIFVLIFKCGCFSQAATIPNKVWWLDCLCGVHINHLIMRSQSASRSKSVIELACIVGLYRMEIFQHQDTPCTFTETDLWAKTGTFSP